MKYGRIVGIKSKLGMGISVSVLLVGLFWSLIMFAVLYSGSTNVLQRNIAEYAIAPMMGIFVFMLGLMFVLFFVGRRSVRHPENNE